MARGEAKSEAGQPAAEAILGAALSLFAARGFDATPVPAIATAAGVATGSIYRYFEGKEALVNAVYRRCKGLFLQVLADGFPVAAAPREQFRHLWRALARFETTEPEAFQFLELHFHAPYLDAESLAVEEALLGFVRGFIVAAQAAGAVKPLAPDVAIAIAFGAFTQLVKQRSLGRLPADPAVLDAAEACVWDALANNP